MKNNNLTQLDTDQIIKKKFDESYDAERVILVGGEKLELSIDSDKIVNAVREGLSGISLPINQSSGEFKIINVPTKENVFIPQLEIKEIQVPVIIKEIEYREIEKPIYIEKVITIEKPVIIREIEFKEIEKERYYPLVITVCNIIQAFSIVAILLINLFKK